MRSDQARTISETVMSKRIGPKIPPRGQWPAKTADTGADTNAIIHKNTIKNNSLGNSSTKSDQAASEPGLQKAAQDQAPDKPNKALDPFVADQFSTAKLAAPRQAGQLLDFSRAQDSAATNLGSKGAQASDKAQGLGAHGPVSELNERAILQDMLERLGDSLDDQMHNLVSGFLHSLPQSPTRPQGGQLGALAQVISLDKAAPRVLPNQLDADPLADAIPRKDLEDMLTANGARAQLLVALGAATEAERTKLDAGKMTLDDFYQLAARGHFGQLAEAPVRYDVLRHKLASAGLDLEFHQLLQELSEQESQQIIDGELSPAQAFAALARARGRKSGEN